MMKKIFIALILFAAFVLMPGFATAEKNLEGKVVLAPTGTIYLIESGMLRPFPTPAVYFSHGFKFSDALPATTEELALPEGKLILYADGTLVKAKDSPTVYYTIANLKLPFVSAQVFKDLGYSFANVVLDEGNLLEGFLPGRKLDTAAIPHPPGTLVNWDGAVYLITSLGKKGIPSMAVFNSLRFDLKHLVQANLADKGLAVEGHFALPASAVPLPTTSAPPEAPTTTPAVPTAPVSNQNPAPPVITGVTGIFPANTQTFTFQASDPEKDRLTLTADWGDGSSKISQGIASGGSFSSSHSWLYIGDYTLTVTASDGKGGTSAVSRLMKVSNDPNDFGAAVTVTTPNGGENFVQGQTMKISWRRNWVPLHTTGRVDIYYRRGGINTSIKSDTPDSSYSWIPTSLPGGDYKIVVVSTGSGGTLNDESDEYFTIAEVKGAQKRGY